MAGVLDRSWARGHTTKSILRGLEVRSPRESTARPSPQCPVRTRASPTCEPPLVRQLGRRTSRQETHMLWTSAICAVLLKSYSLSLVVTISYAALACRK